MRIRPILITSKESYKEHLKRYGILDASKTLYCFVNRSWMNNFQPQAFKAILVSTCVQDAKESISYLGAWSDRKHMKETLVSVYQLTAQALDIRDLSSAKFVVDNAHGYSFFTHFDTGRVEEHDMSFYHSKFNFDDAHFDSGVGQVIPPPNFYSIEHMRDVSGDWYDMRIETIRTMFDGIEIIDQMTDVQYLDERAWYGESDLHENAHTDEETVTDDILDICERVFPASLRGLFHGITFIRETGNGINMVGGTVLHKDHTVAQKAREDAKHVVKHMDLLARELEGKYGNIKLYYMPLLHGDRIQIKFRDYAKPLLYKPGIDRGLTNDRTIVRAIMDEEDRGVFD